MDISFYQVMEGVPAAVDRTVPQLLEKALGAGYKVVVRCPSEDRMKRLSDTLWNYENTAFLAHGMKGEPLPEKQQIYLTTESENPTGAEVMMVVSGADVDDEDTAKYKRLLDIFEASDTQKKEARKRWKNYSEEAHNTLAYYAHEEGKWQKKA